MTAPTAFQGSDVGALRSSEAYERSLVPALFRGWAESLVALVQPRPGERLLDVACGTGIVARLAAPMVGVAGSATGLDADPAMLAVARRVSPTVVPSITWRQGDAHNLPFPTGSFDVVCCQQGLPCFANGAAAMAEMGRVLAPHGRVALSVWRGVQQGAWATALATTFMQHGGPEVLEALGAPCPFGEPEELRRLVADVGFEDVHVTVSVEHLRSRSAEGLFQQAVALTSLAGPMSRLPPRARGALVAALDEALTPLKRDGGFAVPIEANVALARR